MEEKKQVNNTISSKEKGDKTIGIKEQSNETISREELTSKKKKTRNNEKNDKELSSKEQNNMDLSDKDEDEKNETKREKRIYPYIIAKNRMQGYYETLLDDGYKIKFFNKKNNKEIYDFFLPAVRDYMFWTFNLINTKEFEEMTNDLRAVVCANYDCSIFQKGTTQVVCFNAGVCFAITSKREEANYLKEYRERKEMKQINLREDTSYAISEISKEENQNYIYMYILELYKMIYLNIIAKDIQNPNKFDRVREDFVKFTGGIYNVKITDDTKGNELAKKIESSLELDNRYIKIDDEFDLMYKNNKLNDKKYRKIITIIILITIILVCLLR